MPWQTKKFWVFFALGFVSSGIYLNRQTIIDRIRYEVTVYQVKKVMIAAGVQKEDALKGAKMFVESLRAAQVNNPNITTQH